MIPNFGLADELNMALDLEQVMLIDKESLPQPPQFDTYFKLESSPFPSGACQHGCFWKKKQPGQE